MLSIPVYLCVGQIKSGSVRIMGIALGCSADGNQKEKHRHEPIASHRAGAASPYAPTLATGDFGWWHDGFRGWERTRDWAVELFGAQRFDGVFGFSQGAALTGLLAALRETETTPMAFDMAIMVGGFTSTAPQHANLFTHQLHVPSLHVMGRNDGIVPMRDSQLLAERFAEPVIIEHAGGHVIPDHLAITTRIAAFVAQHRRVTTPE
jgi:pimeloyl-ACP methyl ester carboxylesterase